MVDGLVKRGVGVQILEGSKRRSKVEEAIKIEIVDSWVVEASVGAAEVGAGVKRELAVEVCKREVRLLVGR